MHATYAINYDCHPCVLYIFAIAFRFKCMFSLCLFEGREEEEEVKNGLHTYNVIEEASCPTCLSTGESKESNNNKTKTFVSTRKLCLCLFCTHLNNRQCDWKWKENIHNCKYHIKEHTLKSKLVWTRRMYTHDSQKKNGEEKKSMHFQHQKKFTFNSKV